MKEQFQIVHQSAKEERDYFLEYQNIDTTDRPKLNLAGIEFDNISRDKSVAVILDWIKKKEKFNHVLFLDPLKLIVMREGKPLNRITKKASMVLAESGGIEWASSQVGMKLVERISIISLMMDLIRYSEKQSLTLFFLGSKEKVIEQLFFNLENTVNYAIENFSISDRHIKPDFRHYNHNFFFGDTLFLNSDNIQDESITPNFFDLTNKVDFSYSLCIAQHIIEPRHIKDETFDWRNLKLKQALPLSFDYDSNYNIILGFRPIEPAISKECLDPIIREKLGI